MPTTAKKWKKKENRVKIVANEENPNTP